MVKIFSNIKFLPVILTQICAIGLLASLYSGSHLTTLATLTIFLELAFLLQVILFSRTRKAKIAFLLVATCAEIFIIIKFMGGDFSVFFWLIQTIFLIFTTILLIKEKAILGMTLLALALQTLFVNAWYFAYMYDEYLFYDLAKAVAQNFNITNIFAAFFKMGEYQSVLFNPPHTFISGLLQAIFLKTLGITNFAWRVSSIYLGLLAIPIFYFFAKKFFNPKIALLSSFLMAASHYLMSFSRTGFNNTQALFVEALLLLASWQAAQTKKLMSFIVFGATIAFALVVFPAALYTIIPALLLFWFYLKPFKQFIGKIIISFGTAAILILPLLLNLSYWKTKAAGTFVYYLLKGQHISLLDSVQRFFSNLWQAIVAPVFIIAPTRFVSYAFMDWISGTLCLLGIIVTVLKYRKDKWAKFLLLSFVFLLVTLGALHEYTSPPATRMFLLLPYWAVFAAIAILWIAQKMRKIFLPLQIKVIWIAIMSGILILNLFIAYDWSPKLTVEFQGAPDLQSFRAIRTIQKDFGNKYTYVFLNHSSRGIDWRNNLVKDFVIGMLDQYQVEYGSGKIVSIDLDSPESQQILKNYLQNDVIVFPHNFKSEELIFTSGFLSDNFKVVSISDQSCHERYQFWVKDSDGVVMPDFSCGLDLYLR